MNTWLFRFCKVYLFASALSSVGAMKWCAICVIVATACGSACAEGLPPAKEMDVQGDARIEGTHVRLTRATRGQAGAVWLKSRQDVRAGFDTRFTFRFTDQGGIGKGADGLAFVIQNSAPGTSADLVDPVALGRMDAVPGFHLA